MSNYPAQFPRKSLRTSSVGLSENHPVTYPTNRREFKRSEPNYELRDITNKSVISNKIPLEFGSQGLHIKPIQFSNIESETKLSLYSEIERLSVINYNLKRQNDSIMAEMSYLKSMNAKVNTIPELEHHIAALQQERRATEEQLYHRDQIIHDKENKLEETRQKLLEYQQLEQTNNELSYHNKSLMVEIEKLNGFIHQKDTELDAAQIEISKLQSLTNLIDDLKRKIELLTNEIVDRNNELDLYKSRVEELSHRIGELANENEKLDLAFRQKENEIEHWKEQLYRRNREYTQELAQLKTGFEEEKRVIVDQERTEFQSRLSYEREEFEDKIAEAYKKVRDYERKVQLLTGEIERLNDALSDKIKMITDKSSENEDLKAALTMLKEESEETRFVLENGKRAEIENLSRDLRNDFRREREHWENEVSRLKSELAEMDRLRRIVSDKEEEIISVKSRMQEHEDRHLRKIEEIHNTWEGRMKMAIERELKELANRFLLEKGNIENELRIAIDKNDNYENKIMILGEELKKLTVFAEDKNQEIVALRQEMSFKEISHQKQFQEYKRMIEGEKRHELDSTLSEVQKSFDGQLERVKDKNRDFENKVLALVEENARLNGENDDLVREIENIKLRVRVVEQNHMAALADTERKSDLNLKLTLEKEKNDLQARFETEIAQLGSKIYSLTQAVATLESRNVFLNGERDRLESALNTKATENDELKRRFSDFERSRNQELESLKKQFEAYKLASIDLQSIEKQFEAERTAFQDEIHQSRERVLQLENKVARLNAENDRLHQNLVEKTREMDNLRKEFRTIEEKYDREKLSLEEELDELRKGSYDSKEMSIKYTSEKAAYENQIRQLRTINENGKQEVEKLYDLMNQRKREYEGYVRQNEDLRRQVERLQRQLKDAEEQTNEGQERYEELRAKIDEINRERNYYQAQSEKYSGDLTKRNHELHEKIQELDALKQRYEISIDKINADLTQKFKLGERK